MGISKTTQQSLVRDGVSTIEQIIEEAYQAGYEDGSVDGFAEAEKEFKPKN